jgi:hypothetical protein
VCVSVIESILIWSGAIKALRALNLVLMPSTFTVALFRELRGGWGVGLGPPPGAANVLGDVLCINGGGWSGQAWGRQLLLEGEVDALTGVADSRFRPKYLSRREFD